MYSYVSSGGMYLVPPEGPLIEGGAVKLDNKQLANENHARNLGLNWCAFRPSEKKTTELVDELVIGVSAMTGDDALRDPWTEVICTSDSTD